MKKILLTFGLVSVLAIGVQAQHFVTSFGMELGWNIPTRVRTVVQHHYHDYHVVHATRAPRLGFDYFDLVLQRGDVFVEVSVRNDGYVANRHVRYDYPLYDHVCGGTCGYHADYYTTYYTTCHGHNHHGHNHVVYNCSQPYYGHRHPRGNAYGYYKNHGHHHKGKGHGKGKGKHKGYAKGDWDDHDDDDHYDRHRSGRNGTYTRRDRYYDERNTRSKRESRATYTNTSGRTSRRVN